MPKPVLQAMVLADHIYQDRMTGKFVIAGTFSQINFRQAPADPQQGANPGGVPPQPVSGPVTRAGSPYLYLALVEVIGQVLLHLKYVDLSDGSVLIEANLNVTSTDPLAVAECIVPLPMLPATKVGNYSLDLLYDGEILGSWRILARKDEDRPPSPPPAN